MRDEFAIAALQGMWANATFLSALPDGREPDCIAAMAYEQADAMMRARAYDDTPPSGPTGDKE